MYSCYITTKFANENIIWSEIPKLEIPTHQNPDTQNPEIQNPDKFKIPTGSKSRNYILLYITNFCITNFSLLRITSGPKISLTKIAKYTEFL